MDLIIYNQKCNFIPPDHIIDHVYLGSEDSASYEEELEKLNVNSVLVAGKGLTAHFLPEKINYKQINIMDMSDEDIISHLDSAVDFMVDARGKGNVLVHCAMGVSRSASMVIAYLVREHQMSLAEALAYLKEKRSCIKPNRGFMKQLRLYTTNLDLDGTIPREFYV